MVGGKHVGVEEEIDGDNFFVESNTEEGTAMVVSSNQKVVQGRSLEKSKEETMKGGPYAAMQVEKNLAREPVSAMTMEEARVDRGDKKIDLTRNGGKSPLRKSSDGCRVRNLVSGKMEGSGSKRRLEGGLLKLGDEKKQKMDVEMLQELSTEISVEPGTQTP
ncbi:hypothetical protein QYF36_020777 [Acer negundo]|nr:hypothetical protein QYF36_020777 [Acer negundo]